MSLSFVPDYRFDSFEFASCEFLSSIGVKGIILDIDNTLEPYENPKPSERVLAWFGELDRAGIRAAFVSNNNSHRVELFNEELKKPAYSKAKKPFKKNLLLAMRDMGTDKTNTILMGDQVFTDVWAAHNTGIKAILVPPIKDKTDPFTKFKRLLEKPFLRKYERRNNKK